MGIIKSGGICHVLIPDWPIVNTNIVNCLLRLTLMTIVLELINTQT